MMFKRAFLETHTHTHTHVYIYIYMAFIASVPRVESLSLFILYFVYISENEYTYAMVVVQLLVHDLKVFISSIPSL
jgi:hypothetical protein